jgi:hypothetical protein
MCGFYAIHLAANSARRLRVDVTPHPQVGNGERLDVLAAAGRLSAATIGTADPTATGWHVTGLTTTCWIDTSKEPPSPLYGQNFLNRLSLCRPSSLSPIEWYEDWAIFFWLRPPAGRSAVVVTEVRTGRPRHRLRERPDGKAYP